MPDESTVKTRRTEAMVTNASSARRAVFLAHEPPVPLVSGHRIRTFNLMRQLVRRGWRVSLFALAPGEQPAPADLDRLLSLEIEVEIVPFRRGSARHRARLLADIATRRAVHRDFFGDGRSIDAFHRWLDGWEPDVLVAGLYMFRHVPERLWPRHVLDSHNAEANRIAAMASATRTPRAWAAALQGEPVRRYEADAARASCRVVAVSAPEQRYFEEIVPGKVDLVPNGVDLDSIRMRPLLPDDGSLLFVGAMDYSANVDAVVHLVDNVLPRIRQRDVELVVAGSNPRRQVFSAARRAPDHVRVEVAGFVPDVAPYFEACRAFVVPLRWGGGTRLKILEALARGVPIVSTTAGCEGLDLEDDKEILIRDDPADLATAIERLLVDDELCTRLAEAGRRAVEARYDWDAIGDAFAASVTRAIEAR
jgi:glycosyltransferase involved in cell wall biosynthesis